MCIRDRFLALLERWRDQPAAEQGYGPGNGINLLRLLRGDLRGLDLSRLAIRQAYLAEVDAQDARLVDAHLAETVLAEEAAALQRDREAGSQSIAPELMRRYESMRTSFGGTAIAKVVSGHCGACHLGLSRAFLDSLKNAGADALIECEQCGRLLVH